MISWRRKIGLDGPYWERVHHPLEKKADDTK